MSYLNLNKDVSESLKPYLGEQAILVEGEHTGHGQYSCDLTIISVNASYNFEVSFSADTMINTFLEDNIEWLPLLPGYEISSTEFPTVVIHESEKFFIQMLRTEGSEHDVMSSLTLEGLLYDKFKAWLWRAVRIIIKKAGKDGEFEANDIEKALEGAKKYLDIE